MPHIGEYIKKFRLSQLDTDGRRISQLDLSYKIGWANPSTLSNIESGKVTPTRTTLIKIAKALNISMENLNMLLRSMGYKEYNLPLTQRYIKQLNGMLEQELHAYTYPVIVLSQKVFYGDIFFWNNRADMFFLRYLEEAQQAPEIYKKATFIDIIFDRRYPLREHIENWEEFAGYIVANIFYHSVYLPDTTVSLETLQFREKYPDYNRLWEKLEKSNDIKHQVFNIPFVFHHPKIGTIHFHISTYVLNFDGRFYLEHIVPVTVEDTKNLAKYYKAMDQKKLNS